MAAPIRKFKLLLIKVERESLAGSITSHFAVLPPNPQLPRVSAVSIDQILCGGLTADVVV